MNNYTGDEARIEEQLSRLDLDTARTLSAILAEQKTADAKLAEAEIKREEIAQSYNLKARELDLQAKLKREELDANLTARREEIASKSKDETKKALIMGGLAAAATFVVGLVGNLFARGNMKYAMKQEMNGFATTTTSGRSALNEALKPKR